jgi:hypothetical protein
MPTLQKIGHFNKIYFYRSLPFSRCDHRLSEFQFPDLKKLALFYFYKNNKKRDDEEKRFMEFLWRQRGKEEKN